MIQKGIFDKLDFIKMLKMASVNDLANKLQNGNIYKLYTRQRTSIWNIKNSQNLSKNVSQLENGQKT